MLCLNCIVATRSTYTLHDDMMYSILSIIGEEKEEETIIYFNNIVQCILLSKNYFLIIVLFRE